jgi:NADH:ubiquinone oxidoreductase subunit F (NADH-binding)
MCPVAAVDSFYHLPTGLPLDAACSGMACFVARHRNADRWREATAQVPTVSCLGRCYTAPASMLDDDARPIVEVHARRSIALERVVNGPSRTFSGYPALAAAIAKPPEQIVAEVESSGLRGRGGAGFPTGAKWRAVHDAAGSEKFVVVNADEGDPGAYIDRFLMEDDPHALIEGALVACHAVGARKAYVYIRAEYPRAFDVLALAVADARASGALGERFDIELVRGRGSYLCGEETALLNSIEERRPEVRLRPPYPSTHGLFGRPTLVNNVETLVNIPWIVRNGAGAYRALGRGESRGTKVVSLNSLFARPGLYEIEFGMPVREIVERIGGGLESGTFRGAIVGGPLAGIITPELLDTPFTFEDLHAIGAAVGHGGIVAFDERTSIADLMQHIFRFGADESCGKCTPCRLGTRRIENLLREFGERLPAPQLDEVHAIVDALALTSLCAHGSGLAEFATSALAHLARKPAS